MKKHKLIDRLQLLRRDIGSLLFHFTHTTDQSVSIDHSNGPMETGSGASFILTKILIEESLRGSSQKIRGNYECICFTESPISELVAMLSMSKLASNSSEHTRYEPYGIAVTKEWLFAKGGRPVIYQPDAEFNLLSEDLQYRHVHYDPVRGIDFTWEREWRIQAKSLQLDPEHTLVIVPTASEAFDLMHYHSNLELNSVDDEGNPEDLHHKPKWMAISLDLFGFKQEFV
jgi:hypothetical protein